MEDNKPDLGYFMFLNDVIRSGLWSKLSGAAKAIYPVIGIHINQETKDAFPSVSLIQKFTGLSRQSVITGIQELVNVGLITKVKGDPRHSNKYFLSYTYTGSLIIRLLRSNNLTTEVKKSLLRIVKSIDPNYTNLNEQKELPAKISITHIQGDQVNVYKGDYQKKLNYYNLKVGKNKKVPEPEIDNLLSRINRDKSFNEEEKESIKIGLRAGIIGYSTG